jgi:hypothetical protein
MHYTSLDLLNKVIKIVKRLRNIYEDIEKDENSSVSVKIISRVLIKEVDKNIQYYRDLIKEESRNEFEIINFVIYDKISFLLDEFSKREYKANVSSVKSCMIFSLNLEKDSYSLMINIQGRLVQDTEDTLTTIYKSLSDIISYKASYIAMLEKILKEN